MLSGWWHGRRTTVAAACALVVFLILLAIVLLAGKAPTFLDGSVTPRVHEWAHADGARWSFWRKVTHLGEKIFCTTVYLLLVTLCVVRRNIPAAVWVGVCGLTYPLLSSAVKYAVDRPRPAAADPVFTFQETSFPSGHSGSSMTLAITIICVIAMSSTGAKRAAVFIAALAIPLLVGISRLALGVHYPTDVLAGFCLSLVWTTLMAYVVHTIATRSARRSDPLQPASGH